MAGILDLLRGENTPQSAGPKPSSGPSFDFGVLGPALAALDPRNANLSAGLLAMNADRKEQEAKQQNVNQTAQWLQKQGMGPEEANFVASDPGALRAWYGEMRAGNKPDWKIQRLLNDQGQEQDYMVDQNNPERRNAIGAPKSQKGQGYINAGSGNLYDTETGQWISAPGGGVDSVAGLQPVWLRDSKTGKPVLGQMRKDGSVVRSGMPDDTEAVGPYDTNFEKASGTAAGKVSGEAAGAVPGASTMAQNVKQQVEDLKNDPYLPRMLGAFDSRLPNISQDAARVQSKINQLQGGAFLNARQMLKGGGAITDFEGKKAEEAFARLNQAQGEEDFKAALDEFNTYVQQGLQKLESQAAVRPMSPGGDAPQSGGVVDYRTYFGGN